jgi:hypothetical protein
MTNFPIYKVEGKSYEEAEGIEFASFRREPIPAEGLSAADLVLL